jgi:hypothetical protein
MIRKICDFFKRAKQILWPKVDSCSEVQSFIDAMCVKYEVPPIKVIVRSKQWIEWFAGEGVWGCAFWHPEDKIPDRFIAFNGEVCRISGKDRNPPIKIHYRWQVVAKIHTIIHEFIHHYFHHHHGMNTGDHCKIFRKMEKQINAEYGIYYMYNRKNYGMFFHNYWGWVYGESKPSAKDRGWLS